MSAETAGLTHRGGGLPLRLAAWGVGPPSVALVHWLLLNADPIARMCAIIGVLFFWMKAVVLAEHRAAGKPVPSHGRLLAWLLLWPGMRPQSVARASSPVAAVSMGARGLVSIAAGAGSILVARWAWQETHSLWACAPPALVGCSLVLHYGLFTVLTAGWRTAGFHVGPLFRNPLASRSLGDFWTRRWNLAYTEMCQETVMRATRGWGRRTSTFAVFLFSGLLHEAAISLPVNAGYGLPMLYFALNGLAMLAPIRPGIASRLWAAFWVLAPLPLLFHPWFLRGIVIHALGAA
ncbi:MAG: hypothetical protein H6839_02085 [Planctomycetes bacterium]|nr:hypothetical protein [Planctomycetota bacterium]